MVVVKKKPTANKVVSPEQKTTYKPVDNQDRDFENKQNPFGDIKPKDVKPPVKTKPKK